MPKDVAFVTLKLSTTEFILMKEQLEAQYEYHSACTVDESLAPQTRAQHRQKATMIENLLSQLR